MYLFVALNPSRQSQDQIFNTLQPGAAFVYPQETSENLEIFLTLEQMVSLKMSYILAFTNCVNVCNRARNVHANGVTRTQKFVHIVDYFV